jgi:hypothetical protein
MAYVYKITFLPTNQIYIGYRSAAGSMPSDLFETYFTSSKVVKSLISEHGIEFFKKEILAEFDTGTEAYEFEQKLLKEMDVESNPKLLNKRLTSCAVNTFKNHTEKTKKKMSQSRKELWQDTHYQQRQADARQRVWQSEQMREKHAQRAQNDEFREMKREQTKNLWKDESYVKKVMDAHTTAVNDPDYKEWHSQHKKTLWLNTEYRAQQIEKKKIICSDPNYRTTMSQVLKEKWKDPEYREMMLAARKKNKS